MADADDLARMRRVTALPDNVEPYTDTLLSNLIDELGFEAAAAALWREKAASVAGLVDIAESGSSRRLSGLRDAYLGMATAIDPSDAGGGSSYTVPIERV